MNNNNEDDLENAVSSDMPTISVPVDSEAQIPESSQAFQPQVSQEEEIGIHKGAINTLLAERNELIKMLSNVEVIIQAHIARLKELGVEIKMKQPKEE